MTGGAHNTHAQTIPKCGLLALMFTPIMVMRYRGSEIAAAKIASTDSVIILDFLFISAAERYAAPADLPLRQIRKVSAMVRPDFP